MRHIMSQHHKQEIQLAESNPGLRLHEGGANDQAFPVPGQMENGERLRVRLALQALSSLWPCHGARWEPQSATRQAPFSAHTRAVLHRHTPYNIPKELSGKDPLAPTVVLS